MLLPAFPLVSKRERAPTEPVRVSAQRAGENKDFTQRRTSPLGLVATCSGGGMLQVARVCVRPLPPSFEHWLSPRLVNDQGDLQ